METAGSQAPSWDECVEILERLPAMPLDTRVEALERLVRNPSPGIREQALRIGASVLPDSRLTEYLREPADAALRSAGSEILKLRGGRSLPLVIRLLQDPDPDVVLQAVLILDRLTDPRVGSLAAEALARVGGEPAFHALAFCWPAGGVEIDDETMLGLLAHVLEGVPRPEEIGPLPRGFREALSARLHDRSAEARTA